MRKSVWLLFVSVIAAWGSSAQALLIDNGDGTVTDTEAGLMWLKDSTLFQGASWDAAMAWAGALTVGGYDDWRLASAVDSSNNACVGFNCTDTEFGSLFYGALGNTAGALTNSGVFNIDLSRTWFWTETNSGQSCGYFGCADLPYFFKFESGEQSVGAWGSNPLNGWAVRDVMNERVQTASIPNPPVWSLLGFAFPFVVRRRSIKQSC